MDSLLSPLKDQRHKEDVAPLVPGPTAVTARLGGPLQDFGRLVRRRGDVAAACRRFGRRKLSGAYS